MQNIIQSFTVRVHFVHVQLKTTLTVTDGREWKILWKRSGFVVFVSVVQPLNTTVFGFGAKATSRRVARLDVRIRARTRVSHSVFPAFARWSYS